MKLKLIYVNGPLAEEEIEVTKFPFKIGREKENDLVIDFDKSVSKNHCEIIENNDSFIIKDLNSALGIKLNSKQVDDHSILNNDNYFKIGKTIFKVKIMEK